MNENNIALVRATNIIPFDGVVKPISDSPYIEKQDGTAFAFSMWDLLERHQLIRDDESSMTEEESSRIDQENNRVLHSYMPYSSSYNSMVLFSLNGIVPDDKVFKNNIFSNKDCGIITNLAKQMKKSQIVSLTPTDTAIKGAVPISEEDDIIIIRKERYETLGDEEKEKLSSLSVIITEGNLTEAIYEFLENSNRYSPETLSLDIKDGYVKSDTSEELVNTISKVAEENNIPQVLHHNIITHENDCLDRLECVKDEFDNSNIVKTYYQKLFFEYLFSKLDISKQVKLNAISNMEDFSYMDDLCQEIERVGLDKYKKVVDDYNRLIEELKQRGELPTPQKIVDSVREGKKTSLQLHLLGQRNEETQGEHSAEGDLKDIAKTSDLESQNKVVIETKEAINKQKEVENPINSEEVK